MMIISRLFSVALLVSLTSATGTVLVRHSQSVAIPQCGSGQVKLWEGFSLLYVEINGQSYHQDLGGTGSCLLRFSAMPFEVCGVNNMCLYAYRNDRSYWLSTTFMAPLNVKGEENSSSYISRCAVCDVPDSSVMTMHSQTMTIPDCPQGWNELWNGSSLLAGAGSGGGGGGGQSLSSPGSCLEKFLTAPFIECDGARGNCNHFTSLYSFWLTTIALDDQFASPQPGVVTTGDLTTRVSRCIVCAKDLSPQDPQ